MKSLKKIFGKNGSDKEDRTKSPPVSAPNSPMTQKTHQVAVQPDMMAIDTPFSNKVETKDVYESRDSSRSNSSSSSNRSKRSVRMPSATDLKESIENNRNDPELAFQKENYRFLKTLGKGSYATVKSAEDLVTGQRVAVKMIGKEHYREREERLRSEIDILMKVDHRNLLKLLDWGLGSAHIYIVTELALGGELFDQIIKKHVFFEVDATLIIHTLTNAVAYLHNLGIVHRDIKPENIFLRDAESRDYSNLILGDYGIARMLGETKSFLKTRIGSSGYMAPEILMRRPYGIEVDLWSVGVIAYILLSGTIPFPKSGNFDTEADLILKSPVAFDGTIWDSVSPESRDFITKCLQINPKNRITAKAALDHAWFQKLKPAQVKNDAGINLIPVIRDGFENEKMMRIENLLQANPFSKSSSANSQASSGFGSSSMIGTPREQSNNDLTMQG